MVNKLISSLQSLLAVALTTAIICPTVPAFETDQYHLPPVPLADIGAEVTEYVAETLRAAVERVNIEIEVREQCRRKPARKGCDNEAENNKKLAFLRSDLAIPKELAEQLAGDRLMTTRFGKWMASHKFRVQPDRFKPPYSESIFVLNPANHLTMTPTVRLFGHELGIDKLEHIFQQGHQYYEIEKQKLREGRTPQAALQAAIDWGKRTERTYYGLLTSGVYSNADLAANYAGLKFYQGITQPLTFSGSVRMAAVTLTNGRWVVNEKVLGADRLLLPFIDDYLNEALNPSSFRLTLFPSVRRAVKKHACGDWSRAFPQLTRDALAARSAQLEKWHDQDYGHTKRSRTVSIADVCFGAGDARP